MPHLAQDFLKVYRVSIRTTSCLEQSRAELLIDLLDRFGEARLRVTGASMLPSIWPGDVLTIRRRPLDQLRRGEVALFIRDGRFFAHRVVAQLGSHLITQGETLPAPDSPVSCDELLGTVVLLSRWGKARPMSSHVGLPARLTAALVRRSAHAGSVLLRMHSWRGAWSRVEST